MTEHANPDTYEVNSLAIRQHRIRWSDGVEALVHGEWKDAVIIARSRCAAVRLEHTSKVLHTTALDLRFAADQADQHTNTLARFLSELSTATPTGSKAQ